MKKVWLSIILICVLILSACGSGSNYNQLLVGTWYHEGSSSPAFTLYDDGTCEIDGEYGEGTWKIDKNNQLILYNYYGESEMASIISIKNGCLSIGDKREITILYNEPSSNIGSVGEIQDESNVTSDVEKEKVANEYAESIVQEKEEVLAREVYFFNTESGEVKMSEGTILCRYGISEDNPHEYLGIINDKLQFIPCAFEGTYRYSEFSEGYAYINYNDKSFLIIDTEGNIVYESPSDAVYKILCGGNGYYYVEKRISGFDVNEVSYWIVSVDGVWTAVSNNFVSDIVASQYFYCGNGILQLGAYVFINMEDCRMYYTSSSDKYNPEFVGFTEEGELIWLHTTSYEGEIYVTDADENTRQIATTGGWGSAKYGEGLIFVSDNDGQRKFIDLDGNVVIDLSQYKISDFNTGCQFQNGYAALDIIGQDNEHYLTIIDKSGNFVFDPIHFNAYSNNRGIGTFSNGCIPIRKSEEGYHDNLYFVDCSGNMTMVFTEAERHDLRFGEEYYPVYVDDLIFDSREMKFYDMNGNECPITIAN